MSPTSYQTAPPRVQIITESRGFVKLTLAIRNPRNPKGATGGYHEQPGRGAGRSGGGKGSTVQLPGLPGLGWRGLHQVLYCVFSKGEMVEEPEWTLVKIGRASC